ncbi:MAG: glycosyltransferase family 2 protein [Actinomycetales bacterium]
MKVSCVILTMGDRPMELARAIASLVAQQGDPVEIVVVANGVAEDVEGVPPDARLVRLPENVGIPAGRNAGAAQTTGDLVLYLDDDGWLPDPSDVEHLREEFAADPHLGIVSFRIADPVSGATSRRHVPRLRAGDPMVSGEVTTFLGGGSVVRRVVLDECGGLPDGFFYAHEETDLAWRALDAGWRIRYDAGVLMYHPATAPSRHASYYRMNARNRVWLARRRLPWPLVPAYLGVWVALTVLRTRSPRLLRTWFAGFAEGCRTDPGERRPMRWGTVLRMARLGRPPVI